MNYAEELQDPSFVKELDDLCDKAVRHITEIELDLAHGKIDKYEFDHHRMIRALLYEFVDLCIPRKLCDAQPAFIYEPERLMLFVETNGEYVCVVFKSFEPKCRAIYAHFSAYENI